MAGVKRRVNNIVKSAEDKRLYRALELTNDLKVLLISDGTTDKSAASLDVSVGHLSDPKELPGLAHFLEHMLFLGTEKYPSENEYSKFLSEHGGASNACTFSDHTNYYFDVVPEHLAGALDRFAQFFLCPLFTESATEREVNAVNSEHEKNIPNDSWRFDQLDKSTARPDHPFNKFGTGNKDTLDIIPKQLGINVREELLKFHDTWYSSNIMSLAILGKESLDELEELATGLFCAVKNKSVAVPRWPDHPYEREQLQKRAYILPVKDVRSLNITFPIPDLQSYYKAGPGYYLSHLIGHEGPGSLLSLLRNKGWCNSLVGGAKVGSRGFGFFNIVVDLTEEGIDKVDDIVKLVFQYINMLRREGPKEWIFEEYRDIVSMHFRFKDKESPRGYVSSVVYNLHEFPLEEVLSGPYLISDWRPDLIDMVLGYLVPEKIRVAVVGQKFESLTDTVEKWYGTRYKLEAINPETIEEWKVYNFCDDLQLPLKNEFIPTDFDLIPLEDEVSPHPVIIQDDPFSRVWFKQDDEFFLPKASLSFEFVSPLAYLDPLSCNMTYMFVQLFKDALNEYAYAAELAGLRWELTNTKYGMILGIGGYNSKQHVLLDKIIEKLTSFKIDPKRFNILKENYIRGLKNFEAEQPYQHAVYYLAVLLAEQAWTKDELLHTTSGCNYMFEIPNQLHRSSCTEIYYQCNLQSTHSNMLLELLVQLIKEPCFNILRTKEQLGYIVFCGIRRSNGVQGLRVIVQSDRHPSYVDQRVEAFLDHMEECISKMSEEEFERNREALAAQRLEKPKKLSILSARFWSEITTQQYNFDRANIEVAHLRTLTKEDILSFYKDLVYHGAPRRHKIAVHVLSMAEGGAGTLQTADGMGEVIDGILPCATSSQATRIENITDFKSSQAMFPLVQPFINIRPKGAVSKL